MARWAGHVALCIALTGFVLPAWAQDSSTEGPAPALEQLSRQTQSLYEHVRPGVVRIQLPPTYWPTAAADNVIDKWKGRLAPDVVEKLQEEQFRTAVGQGIRLDAQMQSTTQPSDEGADGNVLIAPVPPRLAVTPRPDGGIELGSFSAGGMPYDAQVPSIALKVIGVLVDAQGHVLVPLYIEPGAIASEPLRVTTGDGKASTATFVGSDRQTNLTIFKLNAPVGRPVAIDGGRPADGSLVMVLSPAGDSGRLTVWTGGQQDRGIVVTMDGGVAGFARYGQFLNGAYSKPVIDQLIKFGKVRRATLGVIVEETETPDGQRGMRIDRVMSGSPAERVGLQPNDYILAMAGTPVGDLPSFAAAIASRDGDTELQIMRGDRVFNVSVILKPK